MFGMMARLLPLTVAGVAAGGGGDEVKKLAAEATNAVLELKTAMELRGIVKVMRLDIVLGEEPPSNDAELLDYIERNMDSQGTDPTCDAWGTEYELSHEGGALYVVSCGPDESCGTRDDMRVIVRDETGRFRTPRKNRRRRRR